MPDFVTLLWNSLVANPEIPVLAALGVGVMVIVFGLSGVASGAPAEVRRMNFGAPLRRRGGRLELLQDDDFDLGGMLKAFVPSSKSERTRISKRLRKAGMVRKNAVYGFYLIRTTLAVGLPSMFLGIVFLPPGLVPILPYWMTVPGINWMTVFQIATVLAVSGFYGPSLYVSHRIRERRTRIRRSLPNALDLLHVAVEAGLGFDAAMLRVSREMARVAPDISQEFMMLQLEIQAGKDRQTAFLEMAERTDVEEMMAFAHVILQAAKFGSSVSSALDTFSTEIRLDRELKAQEKANRLPVQMSAVLSLCMMPVLLMICLAPMVIRFMRIFAETGG